MMGRSRSFLKKEETAYLEDAQNQFYALPQ